MKKIYILLIILLATNYCFAQTNGSFSYNLEIRKEKNTSCNLLKEGIPIGFNNEWKVSHGSPSFVDTYISNYYDKLALQAIKSEGNIKTEGLYINQEFKEGICYKISIAIIVNPSENQIGFKLYAANDMSEGSHEGCETEKIPDISDEKKQIILERDSVFDSNKGKKTPDFVTITGKFIPSKNYEYLWLTSHQPNEVDTGVLVVYSIYGDVSTAPKSFKASDITSNSVYLSWKVPDSTKPFKKYRLYNEGKLIAEVDSSKLAVTINGLKKLTNYTFSIKTYDGQNLSDSAYVSFTTKESTAPRSFKASNITDNSVDLSWKPSDSNAKFEGYFLFNEDGDTIADLDKSKLAVTINDLKELTNYTFYIKTYRNSPNLGKVVSLDSALVSFKTKASTVPKSFKASNITHNSVDLSWKLSDSEAPFHGYFLFNEDGDTIADLDKSKLAVTINDLKELTNYTFYIKTYRNSPNLGKVVSLDSALVSFKTESSAPKSIKASNITHNSVDLSWTVPYSGCPFNSYCIHTGSCEINVGKQTSVKISKLKECTDYNFTIVAYDGKKDSTSSGIEFTTKSSKFGTIEYYNTDKTDLVTFISEAQTCIYFRPGFRFAALSKKHKMHAKLIDGCNLPDPKPLSKPLPIEDPRAKEEIQINEGGHNSTNNILNSQEVNIYPNPTQGLFNVHIKGFEKEEKQIHVYNSLGKLIVDIKTRNEISRIDLSSHASALYFVKIFVGKQVYQEKITKQ